MFMVRTFCIMIIKEDNIVLDGTKAVIIDFW